MKILSDATTPFGRKAVLCAIERGIAMDEEFVAIDAQLDARNPLRQIPVLETATGEMMGPNSLGTSPLQADTDGDGFGDSVEVAAGSDPNDWDETPEDLATNVPSMTFLGLGILQGALAVFGLWFGLYRRQTQENRS